MLKKSSPLKQNEDMLFLEPEVSVGYQVEKEAREEEEEERKKKEKDKDKDLSIESSKKVNEAEDNLDLISGLSPKDVSEREEVEEKTEDDNIKDRLITNFFLEPSATISDETAKRGMSIPDISGGETKWENIQERETTRKATNPDNLSQTELDALNPYFQKNIWYTHPTGGRATVPAQQPAFKEDMPQDMYGGDRGKIGTGGGDIARLLIKGEGAEYSRIWDEDNEEKEAIQNQIISNRGKVLFNNTKTEHYNDDIDLLQKDILKRGRPYLSRYDQDIAELDDEIKLTTDPDKLEKLQVKRDKLAEGKGYVPLKNKKGEVTGWIERNVEEEAKGLADTNDQPTLDRMLKNKYFDLMAMAAIVGKKPDEQGHSVGPSTVGGAILDKGRDLVGLNNWEDTLKAIKTANKTGKLPPGLSDIPGDSEYAKMFNKKLRDFRIMNRALQINVDLSKLPEGRWLLEPFEGDKSNDDISTDFSNMMDENYDIKKSDIQRKGSNNFRDATEVGRDFVWDMKELIASIAITKKITPAQVGTRWNQLHKFLKGANNSRIYKTGVDLAMGTAKEIGVLTGADITGKVLFDSHQMVLNTDSGEIQPSGVMFAGSLGFGNTFASKFTQKMLSKNNMFTKTLQWLGQSETLAAAGKANLAAATGTTTMMFAERFTEKVERLTADGGYKDAKEMQDHEGWKHMVGTYIGMLMLGSKGSLTEIGRGMRSDILARPSSSSRSRAASKSLGIEENSTTSTIDTAVATEINKIAKDKSLSSKAKTEKIKKIKTHGEELHFYNEVVLAKKMAKKEGDYFNTLGKTAALGNKIRSGEQLTAKEIEAWGKLKDYEVDLMKANMGIAKGSENGMVLDIKRNAYKDIIDIVDGVRIFEGKERNNIIEASVRNAEINGEIIRLKKQSELKPATKALNESKIERLEAKLESSNEYIKTQERAYDKKIKNKVEAEKAFADVVERELGAKIKTVDKETFAKETNNAPGEAYVTEAGEMVVSPEKAIKVRQAGVYTHEPIHYILRNSLKDPKTGKTSKDGIKIIDNFMSELSTGEQAIIQKRIDNNYRYEMTPDGREFILNKDGKRIEKPKEDYYEEHLTSYVDALKNKEIKYTKEKGEGLSDLILPIARKIFPNLYRGEKYSDKTGKDLLRLMRDFYKGSERLKISKGIVEFAEGKDVKMKEAESRTDLFSDKTVEKDLGIKKETTKKIVEENDRLFTEIKKEGIRDSEGNLRPSESIKAELIKNNLPRVMSLAKKAAAKGRDIGLEEARQKDYGDFYGEYYLKLHDLAETYKAEVVTDRYGNKLKVPKEVPFGAYMNTLLPLKYQGILEGLKKGEIEGAVDLSKAKDIPVDETISTETSDTQGKAKIRDHINLKSKRDGARAIDINTSAKDIAFGKPKADGTRGPIKKQYKGKTYKTLGDLTPLKTAYLFAGDAVYKAGKGVPPEMVGKPISPEIAKKIKNMTDLNQQDIKAVQPMIKKHFSILHDGLSEGHMGEPGNWKSTGEGKSLLNHFYNQRSVRAKTGPGPKYYIKKPIGVDKWDFLEPFGINKDGTYNRHKNINGQPIKALIQSTGRAMTSQAVREVLGPLDAYTNILGQGRSKKIFSITSEIGELTALNQGKRLIKAWETKDYDRIRALTNPQLADAVEAIFLRGAEVGKRYNQSIKTDKWSPKWIKDQLTDGGIMTGPKLFNGKTPNVKYQKKMAKNNVIVGESLHPFAIMSMGKNLPMFGWMKGDGRSMDPKLFEKEINQIKNKKWSDAELEAEQKFMEDNGIDYKELQYAKPVLANAPLVKKVIKIAFGEGSAKSKLAEIKKLEPAIEQMNKANDMLLKYTALKMKQLYNEGNKKGETLDADYVNTMGQIQTNIISGIRSMSTAEYFYIRDGKQMSSMAKPKGIMSMPLDKYVAQDSYKKYVDSWRDCVEWKERYNENIKDPKVLEVAKENKISEREQAEIATIYDLSPKNEHMGASATTNGERSAYTYSNGKSMPLEYLGSGHKSLFAPNYICDMLDAKVKDPTGKLVDNKISLEGPMRMTKFTPQKVGYMYRYNGEPVVDHLFKLENITKITNEMMKPIASNNKLAKNIGINFSKTSKTETLKNLNIHDKAIEQGKKITKERRGMSTWDLDDTLIRTKSGVRYKMPNPSGKPAPSRKVIFMAGGPGSGKSTVIKGLELEGQGFKIVNQDISLEWLMKNHGLPKDMKDFTPAQASAFGKLSWDARMIAKRKQTKFQGKGDGIIVDGTGNSLKTMIDQVREFKNKGYDTQMMFVETSLETALQRNRDRKERSLRDDIVTRTHESVQNNKEAFREIFGDNFAEVKTDNLKQGDPMPIDVTGKMNSFTKGYIKGRLEAGEFADKGEGILAKGGEFDFAEFDIVKEGEKGPLWGKAMDRAKKFGLKDQFVLTARPHAAKMAIYRFLDAQGLNIPFENIITLENSSAEAKALWMAKKVGEGYNDLYFADDAMQNVKAVKNILDQFDVKSKVQQAKRFSATKLDNDFNQIIEDVKGIGKEKEFKAVTATMMGAKKGKYKWVIPPSAADFELLTSYTFAGKGKKGEAHQKWWNDNLFKPFARGINDINTAKQATTNDYLALRKLMPNARKLLKKKVAGTSFTHDAAVRVHRWTEAGFEVPGLSKVDLKKLNDVVNNSPELKAFSDALGKISKTKEGWVEPTEHWLTENITADLHAITSRVGRKQHLAEWIENKNIVFSEKNMNKIEAVYGKNHREALEDMLWRMEHGTNRTTGRNALTNKFMNWTNNSVGAVMFFNMRSAGLQTLSSVNYINWAENNPYQAAKAFANQPQYWKDFGTIFNSDMLKQRRAGLKMNVNEAEIAAAVEGSSNKAQAALSWLLKKGFTPTQIADSFAIASGGSTFYRNRIKMYEKQGLETKEAEKKAWTDFQEIAEKTQQSARPDLISMQQASPLGRLILAFANTPMQYARIMKKSAMDLSTGRGDAKSHVSRIAFYGAIQSMIFASLQSGMFSMLFDDELGEDYIDKKSERVANTMVDGLLRGVGVAGASVSAIKNGVVRFMNENEKGYNQDYMNVVVDMLNVSPTIGSKVRKLKSAGDSYKWNKDVIPEMGWDIENPGLHSAANVVSATTNVPLDRLVTKINNLKGAVDTENENWQRIAQFMGYNRWDLGMDKPEAVVEAKKVVKEKKKAISKEKAKVKREEKKKTELQEKKEEGEKKQEEEKKEGKQVTCLVCKLPIVEGKKYCTVHEKKEQTTSGEKTQCKGKRTNGKRCGMQTSNKSGYCYYHD